MVTFIPFFLLNSLEHLDMKRGKGNKKISVREEGAFCTVCKLLSTSIIHSRDREFWPLFLLMYIPCK